MQEVGDRRRWSGWDESHVGWVKKKFTQHNHVGRVKNSFQDFNSRKEEEDEAITSSQIRLFRVF